MSKQLKKFLSDDLLALFACICLSLLSFNATAVEVRDLYQASIAISNQSRAARQVAQKDVFKKVLVKVSGSRKVLNNPEVKTAVRRASQYLNQFHFTRDDNNEPVLEASFDEGKVNRLLRQESLPIWGKRRPSILLWMAGEDAQTLAREVISKEAYPHLLQQIEQLGKDRGLPVIFPLYDLQDNKEVSVSDIWGHFFAHINKSSQRYNSDAVVISRFWHEKPDESVVDELSSETPPVDSSENENDIVAGDKNWKLQWRLYEKDQLMDLQTISGELSQLMTRLVDITADRYATQYAIDSRDLDNATRIVLTISNVGQMASLMQAEKLLGSFSAVQDVLLKTINNDVAEFEIVMLGELLDLLQGLDLEKRLQSTVDPLAEKSAEQTLKFRWVP